ncbi:MAG TPA: ATP-binding protein, partial [Candidatus Limnocylindrales bacterium]
MSRIGSLVCPIIVGRDDLLARAEDWIAGTLKGEGRTLLLAGQAGVGKTRLAQAIYRKAEAAGIRVEGGSVSPEDRHVPFSSILELARTIRADPAWGSLGADILALGAGTRGDALGRRRTLVLDMADRIAAAVDRPTLVSFEDLQWNDELSLEVIGE